MAYVNLSRCRRSVLLTPSPLPAMARFPHRGADGWTTDTQHIGSPRAGLVTVTGEELVALRCSVFDVRCVKYVVPGTRYHISLGLNSLGVGR